MSDELHWYSFCFMFQVGGGTSYKDIRCGFPQQKVTTSRIKFAKENAGVPADSLISAVSYLGQMTMEEFGS